MAQDPVQRVLAAAKNPDPVSALGRAAAKLGAHTALRILAGLQGGEFSTAQARVMGLTPAAIRWLRTSGETGSVRKGVWRFVSAGNEPDEAITAWLRCWPHAVISHEDAAAFHGLSAAPSQQRHVTVAHGRNIAPAGVSVHVSRGLDPCDRIWEGAVAYTTLARTVCDLADVSQPWTTLTRLDDAVALGAKPAWVHARATALVRGRPGCVLVRDATEPGAAAVFRSWLERAAGHVYRAGHLPPPEWNVRVHDGQGLIGIVDALWRPWDVISEKEGLRFHTSPAKRKQDAERFNRLLDADFAARRFTWLDLVQRPLYVVETLARPLAAAGAPVDVARIPNHIELPESPFRRCWSGEASPSRRFP